MVEIIMHRRNRLADLPALDPAYGAEIDIRSQGDRLILTHDPMTEGDAFEDYLERYAQTHRERLLIVNTKEDGHEQRILDLLAKHKIERFFFLDTTVPTLVRLTKKMQERRAAVRVSEYEPVEFAERFSWLVEWAWVDCFDGKPLPLPLIQRIKKTFKICLVSPELQGYPADRIDLFRPLMPEMDAVCTKYPERWR